MGAAEEIADFAALLRELKQRSGLSYDALAKRAHMSTSTLHRYCKGDGVPNDYAVLSRFARLCKATPEELVELHRRWVLADAARERGRRVAADDAAEKQPEPAPPAPPAPSPAADEPDATDVPSRRRWVLIAAAVAVVVAVSTALVMAPKHGGPESAASGKPAVSAGPTPSASRPHPPTTVSPSPSTSPAGSRSPGSPSDTPGARPSSGSARPPAAIPLTVSTRTYAWDDPQCEAAYLIDRPPSQVAPPVMGQNVPGWVKANGAVAADRQRVALTVQGTGDATVVIESLHVVVVDAGTPPAWNAFEGASGCGGGVETRSFATDLDAGQPVLVAKAGQRDFPYKVSRSDPEVLYITATADTHDVRWYVDLEWNSGGRQGTIRIDDHGIPFRTTGSRGRPRYGYPVGDTQWRKYPMD